MSPFAFPFVWERRESKRNWYNMLFCNLLRVQLSIYLKNIIIPLLPLVVASVSNSLAPPGLKSESYVQEIKMSCTFQEFEFSNIQIWNFSKSWRVDEEFWWKYQNCLFRSIEMKILIFWIFEVLEMSWRPRNSRSSSLTYHKNPNLGFPSSNETKINCFE